MLSTCVAPWRHALTSRRGALYLIYIRVPRREFVRLNGQAEFEQLHTWYDEIKGRTRQVCIKAREEVLSTSNRSSNAHCTA